MIGLRGKRKVSDRHPRAPNIIGPAGQVGKHGVAEGAEFMKSREGLIRLKRFQAEEKGRQVAQIETMIAEFERMAKELTDQIAVEQERSGIHDNSHFAYSTYAKAATQRRDNLITSASDLSEQLNAAQQEWAEALEELQKYEAIAERDHERRDDSASDVAVQGDGKSGPGRTTPAHFR